MRQKFLTGFTLIEILIVVGILALLVGLSIPALNLFKNESSPQQDTFLPSDENRIKDSRHVHFDYSRVISPLTEELTLIFSNPPNPDVSQDIIIADNLIGSQIIWEGEISVGGQMQKIKILTHRLNSPDTQFSVHRDKRYNTKAVRITISGDASGNLIQYQSDGQTAKGSSIYVTDPSWQ